MTHPIKYRTRQEIFNLAYTGLHGQGWRQSVNAEGGCMYRGPVGLKCAIGHCIDDQDYDPEMEGTSFVGEFIRFPAKISLADEQFAGKLQ